MGTQNTFQVLSQIFERNRLDNKLLNKLKLKQVNDKKTTIKIYLLQFLLDPEKDTSINSQNDLWYMKDNAENKNIINNYISLLIDLLKREENELDNEINKGLESFMETDMTNKIFYIFSILNKFNMTNIIYLLYLGFILGEKKDFIKNNYINNLRDLLFPMDTDFCDIISKRPAFLYNEKTLEILNLSIFFKLHLKDNYKSINSIKNYLINLGENDINISKYYFLLNKVNLLDSLFFKDNATFCNEIIKKKELILMDNIQIEIKEFNDKEDEDNENLPSNHNVHNKKAPLDFHDFLINNKFGKIEGKANSLTKNGSKNKLVQRGFEESNGNMHDNIKDNSILSNNIEMEFKNIKNKNDSNINSEYTDNKSKNNNKISDYLNIIEIILYEFIDFPKKEELNITEEKEDIENNMMNKFIFFLDAADELSNLRKKVGEFKYFLEKNIHDIKEKKNLHLNPQYHYNNIDSFDQNSISNSDFNVKYLQNLKEKRLINNFSIIIESPLLNTLFKDEELTEKFLSIAQYATTVMCCRASPYQKSQVVQKIKRFNPKFVTLAIGDGRNDISMLMEANIGIGIYGEEGTSAAQAADFAIGEFKLLRRLLFFHGKVNSNRISCMIVYFIYKNFIFTMTQFFFAFYNLSSGQTLMDDWYITCYNLVFTAFPLCVCALTDIDIKEEDSKECKKCMPLLYKESRDANKIFTFSKVILVVIRSIILSGITFLLCSVKSLIINDNGDHANIWYMSLKNFCCTLIVVSINLLLETKFIAYYLPLVILITTFLFFALFLLLVHYGLIFNFNSKASIFLSFSVLKFYLVLLIVASLNAVLDYSLKIYKIFFVKNLAGQLSLKRALLTTDEAVKKEIMKNTSILRSDIKKEDLKMFYRNSRSLEINNEGNKLQKTGTNESSLIENSQIKMYRRDTEFAPIFKLNKKTRNKILVDNIISKINNSIMSRQSNSSSLKSVEDKTNIITLNNVNNDFSSRKGIVYNGSFKGSKNNNATYPDYIIKVNNSSLDYNHKRKNMNIDTRINPFNNYLVFKNTPNNRLPSQNSAFFGKDQMSNIKKTLSNNINNEESENNIDNNLDQSSVINNENNNDGSSQNIKIYNVKKNNNFYLMLK